MGAEIGQVMTFKNGNQGFSDRLCYALLLVTGLLMAGALLFAANWEADQQERVRMEAFRGDVGDMAQISETIIADRLRQYDYSLLVLREAYTADPKRFAENIRHLRSGPLADRELLTILIDRDGFLVYTDTPNVKPRLYLGDRKYFRYFADGGRDRLYIEEPSFGRVTKRHILPLARPVYDRQGNFIGVIAISVKQESLGKFGSSLHLSEDTVITVTNRNGAVISRSHNFDKVQGTKLPQKLLSPMLKGTDGVFQARAVPDGVERIIAYRHIDAERTDLIVYAEASPANVLRELSQQRAVLMWIAGLTSLIVMVLIVVYQKGRNTSQQLLNTLRKNKECEYETLTGTSLDGFWIHDISGRILDANDTFCEILGYTKEELLNLTIMDIDASESSDQVADHIRSTIDAGIDRFQSRQRRKDGMIIDVELSIQYVKEPEGRFFVFIRDITERKRAEEVLLKSEYEFRSLAESMPQIVWITQPDGSNIYFNHQWVDYTGQTLEESYGHGWNKPFHPDDQQMAWEAWQNAITNHAAYSLECRLRRADGVYKWWLIRGVPVMDEVGTVFKWFGTCTDIDDVKKASEEKQVFEQQMQHTQKLESLGILAGGIAHDFNNILAIIIGYCGLTKMNYETAENNITVIEKAAERAAGLCRQMLTYAGKAQLTMAQVNIGMLVDEMVSMLKTTLPQNAIIKPDLSANIPFINGDASQIRQIVMNLIINASEAIGKEQGEIRVSLTKNTVTAGQSNMDYHGKAIPPGEYVCLEVTDNGCGMDEETKWRIFEPFYTTKFTGRGLGMSVVLGIIMSHNGALQLFSQLGQGTTFKVYLPVQISDSAGDEKSRPSAPSTPWQESGTILLVEDEDQVRFIAKAMLNNFGFTVVEAVNGKEALELYQKYAVDITLVLTDMGMPIMDGYELFHELKKLCPQLPIIISSGFGDAEVSSRIAISDIAGLISKPYHLDQLRDVLKSVLDRVHPHDA